MIESNDPFKDWDASYVLGALSPEERKEYESHLAHCSNCSNAVAAFAGLPGILGKVDLQTAILIRDGLSDEASANSATDYLFTQKLVKRANLERRQTRIRQSMALVAASLVLILIGVTTGVALHSSNANSSQSSNLGGRSIRVTNLQPQIMTATFRVTSKAWGTRFDWNCKYASGVSNLYSSTRYDLIVTDQSGKRSVIATWGASGTKATGLAATSALPLSNIKSIAITFSGSTTPLVSASNI